MVPRLPKSNALLDLFTRTADGVIGVDSGSRIVAWNRAAVDLFGYAPGAVLGKCCAEVLRWKDRHGNLVCGPDCPVRTQADRQLAGDTLKVLATTRSGRALWVTVSTLVLPREHHSVCRLVHFAREVVFTPSEEAAASFVHDDPARRELLRTLTPRQQEVLRLLATGARSAEIASSLGISVITARNHVANILAALKVHSRLEAIALALRDR